MKTPVDYIDPITNERYARKGLAPADAKKRLLNGELRVKKIPFNPGSRKQIADAFKEKYGWSPKEFTPEGRPKLNEEVLSKLSFPEAKLMVKYLTVSKRLGQVADGNESWLKAEVDGRIYGGVNPCGAVTSRCTHSRPNMAQVPRVGALWGKDCRSLFIAPEGCLLVGVDASGLELRCLAHYTYPFDDGGYTKEILEGDIHTANQKAAGLKNRDDAKTLIYAVCYGAGDYKIGQIVGGGRNEGRMLKSKFFSKIPALKKVKEGIAYRLKHQEYLTGIDGRKLNIRSPHSALNTLLQSAGAIAMKEATCILHRKFRSMGWGIADVQQVAHIHDEIQLQCRTEIADEVGKIAVESIKEAGQNLGFRCPLDGSYNTGINWAETH
jgi:DNA polymerase I-like protein with 3'-5' exonuclease and polymerase domains